ncbi:MAG: cobalamin B12-binding domain-containing protein [Candidatus Poseidoniales archaeon]|nr:cobalamin B12-binding domain-containing protein [Candidatus Poseidoniales archaeon]
MASPTVTLNSMENGEAVVQLKGVRRLDAAVSTPLRIVIAKPGLDGHDRGAKIVARALRDGGHEVIYTGLRRTPEQIVRTVMDEDADLLGLSSLSGAHDFLFPRVCALLVEAELVDVVVFGGGIIPEADRAPLLEAGIRAIFGPGTTIEEMLAFVSEVSARRASGEPSGVGEGGDWTWQGTGAV